jgi:hypothetical protein
MNSDNTVFCPECGEEIEKDSDRCKHCGSWFEKPILEIKTELNPQNSENNGHNKIEYSNYQSTTKLAIFIVITGGLYQLYWFYRNWRDFKAHKNLDINVGLRTLALFIPLVNLYFVGTQFRDIHEYAEEAGVKNYSLWVVIITWVLFVYLQGRLALNGNPLLDIVSWIFIIALIIPFLMVQKTLNSYWLKEQGDLPLKKVSGGEVLVLIIGILFVILDIILILML